MSSVEELANEELGRRVDSIQSIKSLSFPVGEKEHWYFSPGLPVNGVEFPYCAACEHELIDHPPSNETAKGLNDKMQ